MEYLELNDPFCDKCGKEFDESNPENLCRCVATKEEVTKTVDSIFETLGIKKKCKFHTRVYDDTVLLSYPPQRRWVCKECSEEGVEIVGHVERDETYRDIINRKKNV